MTYEKSNAAWESDAIASYVATFPTDDGEGACDVNVYVGSFEGEWFIETRDNSGGSDDATDDAFSSRDEAVEAAEEFARSMDEGNGSTAEEFLHDNLVEAAGEPDPKGAYCVYWETALDDEHVVDRYAEYEQAVAAAELENQKLHASHPGSLLCGYSVRELVDGEWVEVDDEA